MKPSLFITGASGFIASHLLPLLDPERFRSICCMARRHHELPPNLDQRQNVCAVACALKDVQRYERHLCRCSTVVHAAALTGRATPKEYFETNVTGTRVLLQACQRRGVPRFLHISSIAACYPDKSGYPYALSKEESERLVGGSTLAYTILRPTIVLGTESSTWEALRRMARHSIIPMPGGGRVRIQPVYVEDVARIILSLVAGEVFHRQTIDLGGPEVLLFRDFMARIHERMCGRPPRLMGFPVRPVSALLRVAERLFPALLPFSAGQLAAFRNDGVARSHPAVERHVPHMKDVDSMLRLLLQGGSK